MTNKYFRSAVDLQREVKHAEADTLAKDPEAYGENEVRQATVHARQDLVLVASLLSSLNGQVATVRRLLWLVGLSLLWLTGSRWF